MESNEDVIVSAQGAATSKIGASLSMFHDRGYCIVNYWGEVYREMRTCWCQTTGIYIQKG